MYCVNDGAVMAAWAESQGVEGSMITFSRWLACFRTYLPRNLQPWPSRRALQLRLGYGSPVQRALVPQPGDHPLGEAAP